jgi:hypothetical protein
MSDKPPSPQDWVSKKAGSCANRSLASIGERFSLRMANVELEARVRLLERLLKVVGFERTAVKMVNSKPKLTRDLYTGV